MKTFDFNKELKKGKQGESEFYNKYKLKYPKLIHLCEESHVTAVDFLLDGVGIELKSDSYTMNTGNYFIERYSNGETQSAGGPWQAKEKGAEIFVYHYLGTKYYAWFSLTNEYFEILESLITKLRPINVKNRTWTTVGYAVNRKKLHNTLGNFLYVID